MREHGCARPGYGWEREILGLDPEHTPHVTKAGPITLDDVRHVFPGF